MQRVSVLLQFMLSLPACYVFRCVQVVSVGSICTPPPHTGVTPVMLRTQYRCHPVFSGLASAHFYGGRLTDGVTHEDRAPLFPRTPPLVFFDCVRAHCVCVSLMRVCVVMVVLLPVIA